MPSPHSATQAVPWRQRLATTVSGPVLRKALKAALLVGAILVFINQGDLWLSGQMTHRLITKTLITPIIPFCVTLLGAFLNSGSTSRPEDLRPGRAAVRRSLIIAAVVGSIILLVNQGDLIFSGQVSGLTWLKIGITPCVPFCVSLYGAYLAYRNALATQRAAT